MSSSVSTAPRVARGPQGPPRQGPGRRHTNRSRRRCVSPLGSCCRRRGHLVHAPRGSKNSVRARTSSCSLCRRPRRRTRTTGRTKATGMTTTRARRESLAARGERAGRPHTLEAPAAAPRLRPAPALLGRARGDETRDLKGFAPQGGGRAARGVGVHGQERLGRAIFGAVRQSR